MDKCVTLTSELLFEVHHQVTQNRKRMLNSHLIDTTGKASQQRNIFGIWGVFIICKRVRRISER